MAECLIYQRRNWKCSSIQFYWDAIDKWTFKKETFLVVNALGDNGQIDHFPLLYKPGSTPGSFTPIIISNFTPTSDPPTHECWNEPFKSDNNVEGECRKSIVLKMGTWGKWMCTHVVCVYMCVCNSEAAFSVSTSCLLKSGWQLVTLTVWTLRSCYFIALKVMRPIYVHGLTLLVLANNTLRIWFLSYTYV